MRDGDVGPPGPGRDADLFGEIVDGEDGAALVGSGDDESGVDAGEWVGDDLGDGGLPVVGDVGDVEFVFGDEAGDERAVADGSDENDAFSAGEVLVDELGAAAGDLGDIGGEVEGSALYALPVDVVDVDGSGDEWGAEREGVRCRSEGDVGFFAESVGVRGGDGKEGEQEGELWFGHRSYVCGGFYQSVRVPSNLRAMGR